MSGEEEYERDPWGFPVHGPVTRPSATVNAAPGSAPVNAKFEQITDNSVNRPLPYMVGLAVLATAGCAFGVMAHLEASRAERETRMLEYYLLELDAKVIAHGIKHPEDSIALKLDKEKAK